MIRLAIIASHPIQYYAPWFRHLSNQPGLEIKVFYLWNFGSTATHDPKFGRNVEWDIPLLNGYSYEFIRNVSKSPGTHHFQGLNNPSLTRNVLKWKPDAVLFTTLFYRSPLLALLQLRLRRIPCLFRGDSHLLGAPKKNRRAPIDWIKRFIFKQFRACLPVGKANRDYFLDHGVKEHRLFRIPHCIDNCRFSSLSEEQSTWLEERRQSLGLSDSSCTFLYVGKFETKKRPVLLAELFSLLPQTDTRLVFVGDGFLRPDLEAVAKNDPRIEILPFQNQSIMPAIYRLGHCLVLPSYGPGETWGLCVNEAMASGLPAIVSSHVGCGPDLIECGKTGWIFDAEQPEKLRQILKTIADDPGILEETSSNARNHIQNYSYDQASRGLIEALESIT